MQEHWTQASLRTLEEHHAKLRTQQHEYNHVQPQLALKCTTTAELRCEIWISVPQSVRQMA